MLRLAENRSFFFVLFFYCELHMVDMCECVCHLFPVNDVHYSDIHVKFLLLPPLGKATCSNWANSTHKQQALSRESECERQRKQQHTRIAKVMGNYKGTGWQLWLQSSEPDEATYFCCQLACTWERICDTQTVHSLYRSSS